MGKMSGVGFVGLTASFLCLLASPRTASADDVVVAEAIADDEGLGSLCIASSQLAHDALAQLISQHLKLDGQVSSVDVTGGNAKVGFRSIPGHPVAGRFPSDMVAANGLHQCAEALVGGYYWPASIGLIALGGIFGNLCAAGEFGCGPSHHGGGPSPGPPGPPGPPPFRPTPRPPVPHPTPPSVSPFR